MPLLRLAAMFLFAALVGAAGAAAWWWPRPLEVTSEPGGRVGVEGVRLLVRFDPEGGGVPSTFRVTLNGADVTDRFEIASNGAHGTLHGFLDGENRVVVAIFGRGPAGLGWWEAQREYRVVYRRPVDWDRG